jgi:nicotinate-nucleotide adenylyltransferase
LRFEVSILEKLSLFLDDKRVKHSLKVALVAKKLAKIYGIDEEKAYSAGLLHDIAKTQNLESLAEKKIKINSELKKIYQEYPQIWHAFVGPLIIKKEFKVNDKNILNAVKWHTTGKAKMTTLEKILFVADYIEPGREFKDIKIIQKIAYTNINLAVYILASKTVMHLLEKGQKIHGSIINCRNYYINVLGKKNIYDTTNKLFKSNFN